MQLQAPPAAGGHILRQTGAARATGDGRQAEPAAPSASGLILWTDEQGADALGVSVRKFHELRREEWFPAPIVLGPRLLRWSRAELELAVANMPRLTQPQAEPAALLRGRIERAKRTGELG